ncbi:MAG: hypothetical protein J6U17_02965 [Kiritimatiellae bacterium]|nr:hypothetical protein [Kiritimatiellia bacterium]
MTGWDWNRERSARGGAVAWLAPLVAAVPWLTVGALLVMMHLVGGTLTSAQGVLFDLPAQGFSDGADTKLVALVMPMPRDNALGSSTLVFFDDARYILGEEASEAAFGEQLAERAGKTGDSALLVLADKRVAGGELMHLADIARKGGMSRILFAERRDGGALQ